MRHILSLSNTACKRHSVYAVHFTALPMPCRTNTVCGFPPVCVRRHCASQPSAPCDVPLGVPRGMRARARALQAQFNPFVNSLGCVSCAAAAWHATPRARGAQLPYAKCMTTPINPCASTLKQQAVWCGVMLAAHSPSWSADTLCTCAALPATTRVRCRGQGHHVARCGQVLYALPLPRLAPAP